MPDILPFPSLFPPKPDMGPPPKELGDVPMLIVFDAMADVSTDFYLSALVEIHQHDETFGEADHELLCEAGNMLVEKYMEPIADNPSSYAHAAVKLSVGWRFVYFVQLWWPDASSTRRN